MSLIPPNIENILKRQKYRLVGQHSAVKLCHWTKKSILNRGNCYKQQFYGIQSHRCLQMTPSVEWCTQRCVFCWRNIEHTLGCELEKYDDPETIVEGAIEAQRVLLSGYGGVPELIDGEKFKQAQDPNQVAISLSGEPTIYPEIGELIEIFNKRNFTTFLVTNGTLPERLRAMSDLPYQLYLSLDAPTKELYRKIDNPIIENGWEKINETLNLFPDLATRRAIRLTMIKGINMVDPAGYAKLIEKAQPDFIEVKAYMFVGGSRQRLSLDNMPSFDEVMEFSENLNKYLNYKIKDYKKDSRVVLLVK